MKIKNLALIFCIILTALLLVGCKDGEGTNTPVTNPPCTHLYSEGYCVYCNEKDPSYTENNGSEDEGDENGGEEEPTVPPIDLQDGAELPFVPAQ